MSEDKKHVRVFSTASYVFFILLAVTLAYLYGRIQGVDLGIQIGRTQTEIIPDSSVPTPTVAPAKKTAVSTPQAPAWGGPELWDAVNKRRVEHGVGGLGRDDLLCSIASFRLNQLLELGKLDNHAGFNALWENKDSQYYWIFEKYNIWEFLVYVPNGSALDAVNLWDNTMGHQTLLRGGQYTIGCTYAARGFGVALAGF